MSDWQTLTGELDRWRRENRLVRLWWRDDDADKADDNLHHLLHLSADHAVPLGLAVSPALFTAELSAAVAQHGCTVLQHGYAHVNHAPSGQKKSELGEHRPVATMVQELTIGAARMREGFNGRFLPVMVPPWNRIAEKVRAQLNLTGFTGISTYSPRHYAIEYGLYCCNTHVDIVNWRAGDVFVGTESALSLLLHHLTMKRTYRADPNEPTGLLTHHQRHDQNSWRFINDLLAATRDHPAVCWLDPADLFGKRAGSEGSVAENMELI